MSACTLPLNYQYLIEIDTTPDSGTPTWARVGKGISSFDPSNNDELDQTKYLDGDGYTTTTVIGGQYIVAITGHRDLSDAAQNYVKSVEDSFGCSRVTNARITDPYGERKTGEVSLANIDFGGGDAGAKVDISFELHFNGKPTKEVKSTAPALSITVAGGTASGSTTFTATPTGDNTLGYSLSAATIGTVYARGYVSGLTAYTSGDDIAATAGQFLNCYELDENGRVVKYTEHELEAGDITA